MGECVRDPDCEYGYVCENQRCVEKPDPCDPSPCGPGAHCMVDPSGNAICRCDQGLVPKPDTITGCGPECVVDPDCQTGYICQDQKYEHIRSLKDIIDAKGINKTLRSKFGSV